MHNKYNEKISDMKKCIQKKNKLNLLLKQTEQDIIKEKTGVGSRCMPEEQEKFSESCICCGKPAKHMVYFGKAY